MATLDALPDKLNIDEVILRKATASDYQGVLNINQDVYAGLDYLPTLYFTYLHNPDTYMYVMEWRDHIIGFCGIWMLENRTNAYRMAGRVMEKYDGKGVYRVFERAYIDLATKELNGPFNTRTASWLNEKYHSPRSPYQRQTKILLKWKVLIFMTPIERLQNLKFYESNVESFSVEITRDILLHADTIKLLKSHTDIIIAFNQWLPLQVTTSNLNWLSKAADRVQFTFDNQSCVAVSFCFQIPLKDGSGKVDIAYIGKEDVSMCANHILTFMSYIKAKNEFLNHRIMLHLLNDIDEVQVEKLLAPALGSRLKGKPHGSVAVCTQSKYLHKAKL